MLAVSAAFAPVLLSGCMSAPQMMATTQTSLEAQSAETPPSQTADAAAAGDFSIPADGVPLSIDTAGDLPANLNYLPTARPGDAVAAVALAPVPVQPEAQPVAAAVAATEIAPATEPAATFPSPPPPPGTPAPAELAAQSQPQAAPATVPAPADRPVAAEAEPAEAQEPVQFVENSPAPVEQKRNRFLSSLFGTRPAKQPITLASYSPAPQTARDVVETPPVPVETPIAASAAARPAPEPMAALPGVRRTTALFEVRRSAASADDAGDVDLHEDDEDGSVQLASAAGLARLAPNGLIKQTDRVDVTCLKPALVRVMNAVERHYGKKPIVTSGYRNPIRNSRARGARNSLHMFCAAADIQVPGVSKWELAQFARSMPGRGGVGTYCHTISVHVDIGPERDWNWRCRRRR